MYSLVFNWVVFWIGKKQDFSVGLAPENSRLGLQRIRRRRRRRRFCVLLFGCLMHLNCIFN